MINEKFVSLETGKLLQKIGFDWQCRYYYIDGCDEVIDTEYQNTDFTTKFIPKPTLDEAQRWLREVKHIFLVVNINRLGYLFLVKDISMMDSITYIGGINGYYKTYEEALENGINKICKNIKMK